MKSLISKLVGLALTFGSSSALAQEFSSKGDLAFGAERLFAFHATRVSTEERTGTGNAMQSNDLSFAGLGIGWRGPKQPSPFDIPRLGVDYFFMDHLSFGGSLGYASSLSHDVRDGSGTDSAFLLAPRVGYAWRLGSAVGFWLRGGVSYHSANLSTGNQNGLALTGEGTFVFIPTPHFAFTAGPTFDIDLFGTRKDNGVSVDQKYRSMGLQFGMLGWI